MTPVSASDAQPVSVAEVQQVKDNSTSSAPVSTARSGPAPAPAQPRITYTQEYIDFLNKSLSSRTPQEILEWALISLPNLVQTTAFGLTGLAILDMISKIREKRGLSEHPVPLIFIDTLYHFPETLALAEKASQTYNAPLQIYTPSGTHTTSAFESLNGQNLWQTDADTYDYLVKVEPGRRAALENHAQATITGRRRSQGASRATIPILELDSSVSPPMLKLNVLATWGYDQVWSYIQENKVPYNVLHDRGYKSVGDWHSTAPTAPGENERDGRWKGQEKTECGLHKDYFKMRSSYLAAKKRKAAGAGIAGDDAVLAEGEPVMKKQDVSA
ncbi:hypothetical protein HDU79_009698 [Rhizoclosmatium sp. JEL0117]|nr:hypothetical protein HDU79_009698 [Rhizoclosmatium sp. JEL0117]